MPSTRKPRAGSLQFWPRKRSKRNSPRIRTQASTEEVKLTGFLGYKAGMTHVQGIEAGKTSNKKGQEVSVPVTIIECPPMKIAALRLYKKNGPKTDLKKEIILSKDKDLGKRLNLPKKDLSKELDKLNAEEYDDIRVLVHTQPKSTGIGKKRADMAEFAVGGPSIAEKIKFVKDSLGKDIPVENVLQEGSLVDIKAVTKGKGFQGPVKRFGISIRHHKSEKAIRNPGSLGPWKGQGGIMWRVAHAGKMGFHQRTEYNKQVFMITGPENVNPKGGILRYGNLKNKAVLIKGGVAGSKKRLVILQQATRVKKKPTVPTIEKISLEEKQGN